MKKIIIYTDGGSKGNPGPAAIGVVFCNEKGQSIKKYSEYLGDKFTPTPDEAHSKIRSPKATSAPLVWGFTNNEAEYRAVIFALKKFKALFGKKLAKNSEIEIRSDSELLVKQLNSKYKILDSKIQPLFLDIWNLRFDFEKVKFKLIPREKNKEADRLVNETLDRENKNQSLF